MVSCGEDKTTNPINIKNGTVLIGKQVWMQRNLDVDHYRNGDSIPEVRDSIQWANLKTGAWCYYNNNPTIGALYGKLYNWYAVNDSRGLAPSGYHIPSDDEWNTLTNYLGGKEVAGGKMKETGTSHWSTPNEGSTNSSCFSALPGAGRINIGNFFGVKSYALWWSSTNFDNHTAFFRQMNYIDTYIYRDSTYMECGNSVRCIKDE